MPLTGHIPARAWLYSLALFVLLAFTIDAALAESRVLVESDSPSWLQAVGKLVVPGVKYRQGHQLNHNENCSATLITSSADTRLSKASADTIVTAWHCLEFYNDLSKPITFTLLYGTPQSFSMQAHRLSAGNSMASDWAVLRLLQPVPADKVAALKIHPDGVDRQRSIVMAGYSKDSPEQRLSYDPACAVRSAEAVDNGVASNCKALKGASGGAVVQLSTQGEPLLAGVISQGDGRDYSVFIPVAEFRAAIQTSLE